MIYISKFGGSILSNESNFDYISDFVLNNINMKHIIVVSAFKNKTDDYLKKIDYPDLKDALAVLGELESGIMLTSHLRNMGIKTAFLNAYEIPIVTNGVYGDADIVYMDFHKLEKILKNVDVLIIPGFQGISKEFTFTTLGRGGSDYTALFTAGEFLKKGYKVKCHLFKDEEYIYDENKKSLKKVTYEKLLSLIKDNAPISKKALEYAKDKKILFSIGKNFFKATKVG